ncbi:MAG TPA: AarF/ABC1/UbiB kinase family protein [Pirellulales bacterium]|nr:AarF/ABC1/UbiB kinase family protein [Pirellulales bacterium]
MRLSTIPQLYRHANRWGQILTVLSKYGLAGWIERLGPRFTHGILKDREGTALCSHNRETRIRLALSELGPTFIKLGQILSTRPDVVGVALADELSKLQDNTPADPYHSVVKTVETELGQPLAELFLDFEEVPLASASIGQVHRARLKNGDWVVAKVRHAGIEEIIRRDLDILTGLAHWAERVPELTNYRPRATVAEFQRVLRRELDFGREERNLQQFAHLFQDDLTVKIPRSYPELSTSRVLTMQYLEGVKLSHVEKVHEAGFDLEEIARRGADLYLTMIFTHGFYHADPHPGNLILMPGNIIGLLDFGMVGRIDDALREEVEEMLLAIGERDSSRLANVITQMGEVPRDLDQAALGYDLADFVAHYAHQSIDEINLSAALNEMTEIIRRYRIRLPARIAMLLKMLVMLEGTARLASPRFSLMEVLAPHQKQMAWRRISPLRRLRKLRRIYSELEHLAEVLPRKMLDIVDLFHAGKIDVHLDHRGLEPSVNRLVLGMLASALFLGSALLLSREVPPLIGPAWLFGAKGVSLFGAAGCVVALGLGLRLLRAINKSGHLDRRE